MLKPTLFIGLGTTGAEIIGYLRELIMQEYRVPEIPIFKMLSIITGHEDRDKAHLPSQEDVVLLQMPDKKVVRDLQEQGQLEWFPPESSDLEKYDGLGSGNLRAIGRLFFWLNYSTIKEKVNSAVRICNMDKSQENTVEILRNLDASIHDEKLEDLIDRGLNIFVFGSLCGGTCSGMVYDFGFMLKNLYGAQVAVGGRKGGVFGIFSILNTELADQKQIWAGNCYTALQELNYFYHHSISKPKIKLPDGTEVDTSTQPYDYTYLLSTTTMNGDKLLRADGNFDHDALEQIIAMDLFLNSAGGTSDELAGLRVDDESFMSIGAGQPDEKSRQPRAFCSFGVSAICYPKYSLARAVAASVSKNVLKTWFDTSFSTVVVDEVVKKALGEFSTSILPELGRGGKSSLADMIRREITGNQRLMTLPANKFIAALQVFPNPDDPLTARFEPEGQYYAYVQTQFRKVVGDECQKFVHRFVQKCRTLPGMSLPAVFEAINKLRAAIVSKQEISRKESSAGTISLSSMDGYCEKLRSLEKDFWLKILFLRDRAIEERKREILRLYEDKARKALRSLLAKFEVLAIQSTIREIDDLRSKLELVNRRLRMLYDPEAPLSGILHEELFGRSGSEGKPGILQLLQNPPRNMHYLFTEVTPHEEVKEIEKSFESERAETEIYKSLGGREPEDNGLLVFDNNVARCSEKEISQMADHILNAVSLEVLRVMAPKPVYERIAGEFDDKVARLALYACPYMEFNEYYLPKKVGVDKSLRMRSRANKPRERVFVATNNKDDVNKTIIKGLNVAQAKWKLRYEAEWEHSLLRGMPHYMFFYEEDPWFSITFMASYPKLRAEHESKKEARDLLWTNIAWAREGGIDIWRLDRAEYIGFLVETAYEVISDALVEGKPFFGWRIAERKQSPYFEMPRTDKLPWQVPVGDKTKYYEYAETKKSREFIPYLLDQLSKAVREFGKGQTGGLETALEKFVSKVTKARDILIKESIERTNRGDDMDKKAIEIACNKLDVFLIHLKQVIFYYTPDREELEQLRRFPWLVDWRKEQY